MKVIANNKKASYDYFLEDKIEAGISLAGTEVKSLRNGNCSIKEAYIKIDNNEVFIINMYVKNYEQGNIFNVEEKRPRKLLLTKSEIKKLESKVSAEGYTIVPVQVYFNDNSKVKIEIALGKGKKKYDKRDSIKKKEVNRAINRTIKNYNK